MREDGCGFYHPHVDADACVGCGLCERVCPALGERGLDDVLAVRWARAKDEGLLDSSSSGGVFGLLARDCLARGGAVYGAAFTGDFRRVRHVRADRVDDLDAVMRSKYLQSFVGREVYESVASDLRAGRRVLFSGTACQVAGMRGYLTAKKVDCDNLLLVDVICHGVPSPGLWGRWVEWNERQRGARLVNMNFRSKTTGWLSFSLLYSYRREKDNFVSFSSLPNGDDWYMRAFLKNASLRPSCFSCPAKRSSGSDVTLGDFWGVQVQHSEAMSERGVSAVIASTEKGERALARVLTFVEHGSSTFDAVLAGNSALLSSPRPYSKAREFMNDVASGVTIQELMCRYDNFSPSLLQRVSGKLGALRRRILGGR